MDDKLKDIKSENLSENAAENTPQGADSAPAEVEKPTDAEPQKAEETPKDTATTHDPSAIQSGMYGQTTRISDMVPKVSEKPRHQIRTMQDREFSMILKTQGRAISQALMSIAGTKQRSSRLWLTAGAMFLIIALLIIQVYYRHRELTLGYELSAAISQREALLEENRKLRIELRVQSLRDTLEQKAGKQLGVSTIRNDQVLLYDIKKSPKTQPTAAGKRNDGLDKVKRIGED